MTDEKRLKEREWALKHAHHAVLRMKLASLLREYSKTDIYVALDKLEEYGVC